MELLMSDPTLTWFYTYEGDGRDIEAVRSTIDGDWSPFGNNGDVRGWGDKKALTVALLLHNIVQNELPGPEADDAALRLFAVRLRSIRDAPRGD